MAKEDHAAPGGAVTDDRVLENLEKGQMWLAIYRWPVVVAIVALLLYAYVRDVRHDRETAQKDRLAAELVQKSSLPEFVLFLEQHPDAEASRNLYLLVARMELDEGKSQEALKWTKAFLTRYKDHTLAASAYLLQAYAQEESGDIASALVSYKKAAELNPKLARLTEDAVSELGKKL